LEQAAEPAIAASLFANLIPTDACALAHQDARAFNFTLVGIAF